MHSKHLLTCHETLHFIYLIFKLLYNYLNSYYFVKLNPWKNTSFALEACFKMQNLILY